MRDIAGGGVSVPWTLAVSIMLGIALMSTRLLFDTVPPMAHADHLIGALVITVSVAALAECARPLRFLNVLLGLALLAAPWMLDGASTFGEAGVIGIGMALIALALPRGHIGQAYAGWNKWLV
jgi:hypothetical protein